MIDDGHDPDTIRFLDEDICISPGDTDPGWLIAVIDDEPAVFEATRLALDVMRFDGRPIKLLHAASGEAGKTLLMTTPDIACILLDVVMETDQAGLDLVREIREELRNEAVRIVVRSGQPGYAPPLDVIQRYDINDYREKTELTQARLWTSVVCALRSYKQILTMERSRQGLRSIIAASAGLMRRRSLADFYRGGIAELTNHLDGFSDGLLCIRPAAGNTIDMVGASGRFEEFLGQPLHQLDDEAVRHKITQAFARAQDASTSRDAALHFAGQDWQGVIYVASETPIDALRHDLLRLFCHNVSLGLETARLLDHVSELAYTDRVTGLASRSRLEETIGRLIAEKRVPQALVVNVDGFSDYTTGMGDGFGDALLRAFAQRLLKIHPYPDRVACLYRDVFCLLLDDGDNAEDLRLHLQEQVTVASRKMRLGLSFGLSAPFEAGTAPAELIRQGEVALKSAKHVNQKEVIVFSLDLERAHQSRAFLSHELRDALESGQVRLVYQPQVDVTTERLIGAEALMRWDHPRRGSISPVEFIDAAETSGLIRDVGCWVTRRACREMKPLIDSGALRRVMINLSPIQLRDPGCLAELSAIVDEEGVPFSAVEWEITESATLGGGAVIAQLQAARDRGFTLALDDFGTGYSSLSMIRTLPLNVIKIDRSFLLEVATNQEAWSILFSIASICKDLSLAMVAEGVESDAQLKIVRDAKIDTMQGYLISRPLPADRLVEWVKSRTKPALAQAPLV
jgi:predicted signal transduction protein with EAL and GGDEF domain